MCFKHNLHWNVQIVCDSSSVHTGKVRLLSDSVTSSTMALQSRRMMMNLSTHNWLKLLDEIEEERIAKSVLYSLLNS